MPIIPHNRTHCRRGHPWTPENIYTYSRPSGIPKQMCKACVALKLKTPLAPLPKAPKAPKPRTKQRCGYFVPNDFTILGPIGYVTISTQSGPKTVLIDASNIERVIAFARWNVNTKGYFFARQRVNGQRVHHFLHRFVMNAPDDMEVDHINRNVWDCRCANLRCVSKAQNQQNRTLHPQTRTGIKNVFQRKHSNKFEVAINANGKFYYGGTFESLEQAAVKAQEMRRELHTHCPENSIGGQS